MFPGADPLNIFHRISCNGCIGCIGSSDLRITPQRWDQKRCNEVLVLFSDLSFFSLSLSLSLAHTQANTHTHAHTRIPMHTHTHANTRACTYALMLLYLDTYGPILPSISCKLLTWNVFKLGPDELMSGITFLQVLTFLSLLTYFLTSHTFSIFRSPEIMKIINFVMRLF